MHSTGIRIFLKMELFFSEYGFRLHVNSVFGNRNRDSLKTVSRLQIFLTVYFLEPCGQRKMEVFENDDVKCRGQTKTI